MTDQDNNPPAKTRRGRVGGLVSLIWGDERSRHIIRLGQSSSIMISLLMLGAFWARPILDTIGARFSNYTPDTRWWVESFVMLLFTAVLVIAYKDIQLGQVLARQVTNIAQDEADFWLSLIPVILYPVMLTLQLTGVIRTGLVEWICLTFILVAALFDLFSERWISKRLVARTVAIGTPSPP